MPTNGSGHCTFPLCARQLPSVAIFAGEVLICLSDVGDLHVLLVPQQRWRATVLVEDLSAVPDRHPSQSNGFGAIGRIQETALRCRPALKSRDPLRLAAAPAASPAPPALLGLWKTLAGAILLHLLRRNDLVVQDHSLVADEQSPSCGNGLAVLQQFVRCEGAHSSVVPVQLNRRPLAVGRELEAYAVGVRESEVIHLDRAYLVIDLATRAGLRLDAVRNGQVQRHENRPHAVVAHIRNAAGAEIVPAAEYGMRVVRVVWTILLGSQPQVPVEICRNGRPVRGKGELLGPEWPVGPIVHLL